MYGTWPRASCAEPDGTRVPRNPANVAVSHALNFTAGWWLILAAFATGAVVGLGFHREEFLGGYGSFRRRMLRLGHVAFAALGILNVVYGLAPVPAGTTLGDRVPGMLLLAGGVAMPIVCFLTAWRPVCRHAFFIPVTLLVAAVIGILLAIAP